MFSLREHLTNVVGKRPAAALLAEYDDISSIERAPVSVLSKVEGIGPGKAKLLKAAMALGRKAVTEERRHKGKVNGSDDIYAVLEPRMRHLEQEMFVAVLLDGRHNVRKVVEIARGGLTACAIHPREVFMTAVREGAAAIVVAHNHPSGDPAPSAEDIALTRRLVLAGETLGIPVIDHLVLGDGEYSSLSARGLMLGSGS